MARPAGGTLTRRRGLKTVPETQPQSHDGDTSLTREALAEWNAGQRKCRARRRHNWGPYTVWEYPNHYEVTERCTHCGNRRTADYGKTSYGLRKITKWKPVYRDGYLLPKGAAPLDEDMVDELVASDILSRKVSKAADEVA